MEQLELLWNLQEHDFRLKQIKSNLEELAKKGHIETMTLKLKSLEKRLDDKKDILGQNDERLKDNSNLLKKLNYQLKEIEENLYNGTVTDLKQLSYMDKECKQQRELINDLEIEILSLMEDIDGVKHEIYVVEKEYEQIKNDFKKDTEEYKKLIEQLRTNARKEIEYIYDISSKINRDLYEKYNNLKKNKGFAIASVEKDECSGCHMIIPVYILDNLKRGEKLQCCENCGRILYLNK